MKFTDYSKRMMRRYIFLLITLLFVIATVNIIHGQAPVSCGFNKHTLRFSGASELDQAKCLLRKVKEGGDLGERLEALPEPLETLIGRPVAANEAAYTQLKIKLRSYLTAHQINETNIGGSLDAPLSRARNNNRSAPMATYFVIHDTSTPNLCDVAGFPPDVNESTWKWKNIKWNEVERYRNAGEAHLYITRDGQSIAASQRSFATPWRATQIELPKPDVRAKGLFLHIENVQPRRCAEQPAARCYTIDPKTHARKCREDSKVGPNPGLSDAQMERLALVYVAASLRRKQWMVPAFHAALDAGISGGHDDPQNFDLTRWANKICSLLQNLQQTCPGR